METSQGAGGLGQVVNGGVGGAGFSERKDKVASRQERFPLCAVAEGPPLSAWPGIQGEPPSEALGSENPGVAGCPLASMSSLS